MTITSITSYLVSPGKNLTITPPVQGTTVPLTGKLFGMLSDLYNKSDTECDIPIRFVMDQDGTQHNEMRSLITNYISDPTQVIGNTIAERLSRNTNSIPGLGLLFLILGMERNKHKVVISRFPAEEGVLADIQGQSLEIQFIERIFMKNSNAYKAALYSDTSLTAGFWEGYVIDRQINYAAQGIAQYWIYDFLSSDFITTSKTGTKRFALALREASKKTSDPNIRHQIVSLSVLVGGYGGRATTIHQILENYRISDDVKELIISNLPQKSLERETFTFDLDEFREHIVYTSIELDNESTLIAPTEKFESCFDREVIDSEKSIFRFSTQGTIVEERVKGNK
jgi:hypothetical protein